MSSKRLSPKLLAFVVAAAGCENKVENCTLTVGLQQYAGAGGKIGPAAAGGHGQSITLTGLSKKQAAELATQFNSQEAQQKYARMKAEFDAADAKARVSGEIPKAELDKINFEYECEKDRGRFHFEGAKSGEPKPGCPHTAQYNAIKEADRKARARSGIYFEYGTLLYDALSSATKTGEDYFNARLPYLIAWANENGYQSAAAGFGSAENPNRTHMSTPPWKSGPVIHGPRATQFQNLYNAITKGYRVPANELKALATVGLDREEPVNVSVLQLAYRTEFAVAEKYTMALKMEEVRYEAFKEKLEALKIKRLEAARTAAARNTIPAPQRPITFNPKTGCAEINAEQIPGPTSPVLGEAALRLYGEGEKIPEAVKGSFYRLLFGDEVGRVVALIDGALNPVADAVASLDQAAGVLDQEQIKQQFERFPELYKHLRLVDSARFGSRSAKGRRGVEITLTSVARRNIRMVADRDWERACSLLDRSFEAHGKGALRITGAGGERTIPHPFDGKACSKDRLKKFVFINFESPDTWSNSKVPALTLVMGPGLGNGQVFVDHDRRTGFEAQLNADLLAFFNPNRYESTGRKAATAPSRRKER